MTTKGDTFGTFAQERETRERKADDDTMSSLGWTEKQRKLKQHARETAARRRKWEKIAADQEAEEEYKLKLALEQRKRELDSKNRYLRQPLAKPPPAKRSFLVKGSKRGMRAVETRDDALTNQGRRNQGGHANGKRESLKRFIKEKRAALKGQQTGSAAEDGGEVCVAAPRPQWRSMKEEAGAELENILNRYSAKPAISRRAQEVQPVLRRDAQSEARDRGPQSKPPMAPRRRVAEGEDSAPAPLNPAGVDEDENEDAGQGGLGPASLRRGCVSTARHRPVPRMVFSADSLDGSAVELMMPGESQPELPGVSGERDGSRGGLGKEQESPSDAAGVHPGVAEVEIGARVAQQVDLLVELDPLRDSLDLCDEEGCACVPEDDKENEEVEDVPKLSGSVLELKYFGDLASEQGGSPASTGNVVSEAKKEKEMDKPLAWWCDAQDVESRKAKFDDEIEKTSSGFSWCEGGLLNTTNKNKLPKKDLGQNRYGATDTSGRGLVKDLKASPPLLKPVQADSHGMICMRQTATVLAADHALFSPRKAGATGFASPLDQSLGLAVKSKAKRSPGPPPAPKQRKAGGSNQNRKSEKVNIGQGVEGPLMFKGSYAQTVQDKVHSLEMGSKGSKTGSDKRAGMKNKMAPRAAAAEPLHQLSPARRPEHAAPRSQCKLEFSSGGHSPVQSKPRQYKHITPADLEAFTKPSVVRFADRVRDKEGMVTTLSMEESRLRKSLARLDREYLELAPNPDKGIPLGPAAGQGSLDDTAGLTEDSLMASLQRLDLLLKRPPASSSTVEGQPTAGGPGRPKLFPPKGGPGTAALTTPLGFKRTDVALNRDSGGGHTVAAQPPQAKPGFVYRNLTKAASGLPGTQGSGGAGGPSDRRNNVGLTNGKAGQQSCDPGRVDVGMTGPRPPNKVARGGSGAQDGAGGLQACQKNHQQSSARSRKNQAVRMHLGDSGGKIVLSQAAKALLL